MHVTVIAPELAIGPVHLAVAALAEIAFEHKLGVGRHRHAVGDATHHRQRRPPQCRHQRELVDRHLHLRRAEIDRMDPDREAHRQPRAALDRALEHLLQVGGVGEIGRRLGPAEQHQPAAADIALARYGIDRKVERGGDIWPAVLLVLKVERQRREIDLLAGLHHRVHRCILRFDLDHRLRLAEPAHDLGRDGALVGLEGRGNPPPAAGDCGHQLEPLGPGLPEQRRLAGRLDPGAQIDQVDRLLVHRNLVHPAQRLNEPAQTESFEVDLAHGIRPPRS